MDNQHENAVPKLGIGACLTGEAVRYNGVGKRANESVRRLSEHFSMRPFCPEVAIGLGVPREPIRLVGEAGSPRAMDSATQTHDYTDKLQTFAERVVRGEPDLCGYILVKGSPSCGYKRVKRYNESGNAVASDSAGVFASALQKEDPLLPVEEDGRLNDPALRESFVCRAMTYHDWKQLCAGGLTRHRLIEFYSRHKYLVMAHDYNSYKAIGRLLADAGNRELGELAAEFITALMAALARPANRRSHSNALLHITGYLKRVVSSRERQQLRELIQQYSAGLVPLVVPITMLRHHFSNHPDPYITKQTFLSPYPDTLQLRNQL